MADLMDSSDEIGQGLSGHSVRGAVDDLPAPDTVSSSPDVSGIEETVHQAVEHIQSGMDMASQAMEKAVESGSDKIFAEAANPGVNIADSAATAAQHTFSWSGYFQAIGILCLLLAALWFAVWCIRRYGKFNFLPRPGSLPKDSLIMEAQMPLGPKKGLMVVRFLNKRLLLGVTEHQISLISEEKAENERPAKNFQGIMDEVGRAADNSHSGDNSSS